MQVIIQGLLNEKVLFLFLPKSRGALAPWVTPAPPPHEILTVLLKWKLYLRLISFSPGFFVHKVLVNCYSWNSQIRYAIVCNKFFFTFMYYMLKTSLAFRISKTIVNLWSCRLLSTPGKNYLFVLIMIKINYISICQLSYLSVS